MKAAAVKNSKRPTYLRSAALAIAAWTLICVIVGFRVAVPQSIGAYWLAVITLLVIAPAMHVAGIVLATRGIGRGFSRLNGFMCLILHAILIAFGFIFGAAALVEGAS